MKDSRKPIAPQQLGSASPANSPVSPVLEGAQVIQHAPRPNKSRGALDSILGSILQRLNAGTVAAYITALGLAVGGGPVALALVLFPGVFGVFYSTRWLPVFEADRLKDVLVVGTAAVAVAWAVPLALLPLAFDGHVFGPAALVVLVFFFLRTVIAVELFNIRDVSGDRREGVSTLPVVFGTRPTQYILGALNGCSFVLLLWAVRLDLLAPVTLAVTPAIAYSLCIVTLADGERSADRLCLASYFESPLMVVLLVVALSL
ncbi:MAG: UbiA family prenyltransferase [Euryarchaeota archaeon]|nr:UbiA family prenyltransferase [Euryarchaeota archaeon]